MTETDVQDLTEELDIIKKTIAGLPENLTTELICNLFANIIVSYGLFDQIADINAGTILCACQIYEEQQSVFH